MRLTCPNCGAVYETPAGMVPEAGRHVQCSACHTRWFVRGTAPTAVSEEQILTRLESWRPRPVTTLPPAAAADAPRPRPAAPPLRVVPAAGEQPTKPAEKPTVARPAPVAEAPARPAPRLDLHAARAEPEAAPVPPAPRSQALPGFLLVLALAVLAWALYRFEAEIAATVPAAAPALDAYATTVDGWRTEIEDVIAPYRPGAAG